MNPLCPKCGRTMMGGAPHGDWAVQYECWGCNYYQHDADQRPMERLAAAANSSRPVARRFADEEDDES